MRAGRALLLLVWSGCQEYGYTSNVAVDVFQQRAVNAVDLLIVVDNSCSMVEEQDNLAQQTIDEQKIAAQKWIAHGKNIATLLAKDKPAPPKPKMK